MTTGRVPATGSVSEQAGLAHTLAEQCRLGGLEVPLSSALAYGEALSVLGPRGLADVYWAGRATLVRRPEDQPVFDEAFATLLAGVTDEPPVAAAQSRELELAIDDETDQEDAGPPTSEREQVRFSRVESLRHADFAELDETELAEAHRLMGRLDRRRATRRSRRRHPATRGRGPLDVRRTARRALRSHGEPVEQVVGRRRATPRRLVLLVDVSGSMEPYARALLRFAHVVSGGWPRVEVFALGTRLTRLTRTLAERDPDAALAGVAGAVEDWAGGTRLGETLRSFNDEWGVRGLARGAVVVILSDGWDRGRPELLAEQMARLGRVANRVVWVNPLKASEGYAPLAQGMAAALPHVDTFVSGHSLAALDDLVEVITREGAAR